MIHVDEAQRIAAPTLEQFAEAAEVNYERTPYQRRLDSPGRFAGFQKLGVELATLRRGGRMEAVSYLLPASAQGASWVFMFQLAARMGTAGAGALLVRRIMQWYPAILGIGITPDAERMYKAFKWTYFGDVWRAVHPLNLDRMLDDYGDRMDNQARRKLLRSGAWLYNAGANAIERALSLGVPCEPTAAVSAHLPAYRAGNVVAIDVGGVGRIGNRPVDGLGSLRSHAAIWREMRRNGVKFCEMLAHSPECRSRAIRLGYYPIRLPVWYWDKNNTMGPALDLLRNGEMSFLDTDKVV